jgi:hypothetical protein
MYLAAWELLGSVKIYGNKVSKIESNYDFFPLLLSSEWSGTKTRPTTSVILDADYLENNLLSHCEILVLLKC